MRSCAPLHLTPCDHSSDCQASYTTRDPTSVIPQDLDVTNIADWIGHVHILGMVGIGVELASIEANVGSLFKCN